MVLGAQGILESPDDPEPVSADDIDPVVLQEGVLLGSGVGDEDRGDRDSEAVMGDADEKDITTRSGLEDVAQPIIKDSDESHGPPSSPIAQELLGGRHDILSSELQSDPSTEPEQTTPDLRRSRSSEKLEQQVDLQPPLQVEAGKLGEQLSTDQPEKSPTDDTSLQHSVGENTGLEQAEQDRSLSPSAIDESQITTTPSSLTEIHVPDSLSPTSQIGQIEEECQQANELVADSSNVEQPSLQEHSLKELSAQEVSTGQLGVKEPSMEGTPAQEPSTQEPSTQEPGTQEPIEDESSVENSSIVQHTIGEPNTEEVVVEHSVEQRSIQEADIERPEAGSQILPSATVNEPSTALAIDSPLSESGSPGQQEKLDDGVLEDLPQELESNNIDGASPIQESILDKSRSSEALKERDSGLVSEQLDSPEHLQAMNSANQEHNDDPDDDTGGADGAGDGPNQVEIAQAFEGTSGSQTTDTPDDMGPGSLSSSTAEDWSQIEQDAPGPSLQSSDVLPENEQPCTVTESLNGGDTPVQAKFEEAGQQVDANDVVGVRDRTSQQELPNIILEQPLSIGDSSEPKLDAATDERAVSDQVLTDEQVASITEEPSQPGTVESPESLVLATNRDLDQSEVSVASQEAMNNGDRSLLQTGGLDDKNTLQNDIETSSTLEGKPVDTIQDRDQDLSDKSGGDIDLSAGDSELFIEQDLPTLSSGQNSGQATPRLPLSTEAGASSHDLEGQERLSVPSEQLGDNIESVKTPDSFDSQDRPREDGSEITVQEVAEPVILSHGDGSSQDGVVPDEIGLNDSVSEVGDSACEVPSPETVPKEIDQQDQVPLESSLDPVVTEIHPAESLSDGHSGEASGGDQIETAEIAAAAAGVVAHGLASEKDDIQDDPVVVSASADEIERPRTADKATGTLEEPATGQDDLEVRSISSAPDSPEEVSSQQPLAESFTMVDPPSGSDQAQAASDMGEKPVLLKRVDSSTQTDELWRPKTPLPRVSTPGIVLPDPNDEEASERSRARSSRRMSRRQSVQQAEEVVAAAVIIRAAADTLGETSDRMAGHVKDLKQRGETTAPSKLQVDGRGTRVADNSIPYDFIANPTTGKESPKADDKLPKSPRSREHRASHSSRSSRPSTREDGTTRPPHHRHSTHKHRADGERESDQVPRTPPRHHDTGDSAQGSHSSRSRRERTPQEQAEHDRRKEERRLAREKERARADSPAAESKGKEKEVEAPPSADRSHRSSRRHSSTRHSMASPSNTARTEASTAAPSKKFFDMKNGRSEMGSSFGGPLTADTASTSTKDKDTISSSRRSKEVTRPPPVELKRSSTTRSSKAVRRSLDQSHAKLQKAREQESTKAAKESQPRRDESGSPAPVEGKKTKDDDKHRKSRLEKREKEDKDEKKKSSGGLKGMFKRLFSS